MKILLESRSLRGNLDVAGVGRLVFSGLRVPARDGWDARAFGFGGWSFDFEHRLDLDSGMVRFTEGYSHAVQLSSERNMWIAEIPSRRERHRYDKSGRLMTVEDLATGFRHYSLTHTEGHLATLERRAGQISQFLWTDDRREVKVVSPSGISTRLRIDERGWLAEIESDQNGTQVTHDDNGLLLHMASTAGASSVATYDDDHNLERLVDNGHRRDVVFTKSGNTRRYTLIESDGEESSTVVEEREDGSTVHTRRCCGVSGAVVTVSHPSGSTSTTTADGTRTERYLEQGDLSPLWGTPTGPTVSVVATTSPGGRKTVSRRWTESAAEGTREIMEIDGRRHTSWFDAGANVLFTSSPAGRISSVLLDEAGRPLRLTEPGAPPLVFGYDDDGLVTSSTRGVDTTEIVDRSNGVISIRRSGRTYHLEPDEETGHANTTGPDGVRRVVRRDADRIVAEVDGEAVVAITDDDTDVTSWSFPSATGFADTVSVTTNQAGQPTKVVEPHGTTHVAFDDHGLVTEFTDPTGSVQLRRDVQGRVIEFITSWDEQITIERDGDRVVAMDSQGRAPGRVERLFDGPTDAGYRVGPHQVDVSRDDDDIVTAVGPVQFDVDAQSGLTTGRTLGQVTESISGDHDLRYASQEFRTSGGALAISFRSEFNANNQIARRTEVRGEQHRVFDYRYDEVGRLIAVLDGDALLWRAEFDNRGNRVRLWRGDEFRESEFDARDRLVRQGATTFTYDSSDRLIECQEPGGITTNRYDTRGQLTAVERAGHTVQYVYNAIGERIARYVDGVYTHGYLWLGSRLVAVLDEQQHVACVFLYGDGRVPVAAQTADRTLRIVTDQVGSIRALIDSASGQLEYFADYDVDGQLIGGGLPDWIGLGFACGLHDPLTRQLQFGARVYDPKLARWTRRDPALLASGSFNFHEYCSSDPVNRIDPSGLTDTSAAEGGQGSPDGPSIAADPTSNGDASIDISARSAPPNSLQQHYEQAVAKANANHEKYLNTRNRHPKAPARGVGICRSNFSIVLDHGMISVDGRLYGWNPNPSGNLSDWTNWRDQSGEKLNDEEFEVECNPVPDVDPECVMSRIKEGGQFKDAIPESTLKGYFPIVSNTCWTPVFDTIRACGGAPYEHLPRGKWLYPVLDVVQKLAL